MAGNGMAGGNGAKILKHFGIYLITDGLSRARKRFSLILPGSSINYCYFLSI